LLVGLLVAGNAGLSVAAIAPAAQASAVLFYDGSLAASPTDPGLVTVTFTNTLLEIAPGFVDLTNPSGTISVPVAAASATVPNQTTTYTFRLAPGQTAQARIGTAVLGAPYTNPGVTLPNITPDAPHQTGNVVVVPLAKPGVQYVDGAGNAVSSGPLTLGVGETLVIKAVATVPPLGTLTGTTSWSFSYVAPTTSQVTPAAPTRVSGNLIEIPASSGYHYEVGGQTVSGTTYVPKGGLTITAVSDSATLELVGQASWSFDYATPPRPNQGNEKVMICHATGSATNPYRGITVSVASLRDENDHDGHAGHDGDIWPEITYQAADDFIVTIAAHNWNEDTAKIFANHCKVGAPTTPPSDGDDDGDHGGDNGGDDNHGGGDTTPPPSGGNTGGTTGGGTTTGTGSTTSSVPVTTSTSAKTATTSNQPASTGLLIKADTGVDPSTDPASITVIGGLSVLAAIGGVLLYRRPKHWA
jgi:hypothetical protein